MKKNEIISTLCGLIGIILVIVGFTLTQTSMLFWGFTLLTIFYARKIDFYDSEGKHAWKNYSIVAAILCAIAALISFPWGA